MTPEEIEKLRGLYEGAVRSPTGEALDELFSALPRLLDEVERLRASISPDCCICGIPDDPVYGPKKRRFTDAETSAAAAEIARRLRGEV